jgi:hypothetical protein
MELAPMATLPAVPTSIEPRAIGSGRLRYGLAKESQVSVARSLGRAKLWLSLLGRARGRQIRRFDFKHRSLVGVFSKTPGVVVNSLRLVQEPASSTLSLELAITVAKSPCSSMSPRRHGSYALLSVRKSAVAAIESAEVTSEYSPPNPACASSGLPCQDCAPPPPTTHELRAEPLPFVSGSIAPRPVRNGELAYDDTGEIHTVRTDGSGDRVLTTGTSGYDGAVAWSPDGRRLAFVRTSPNPYGPMCVVVCSPADSIEIINADGGGGVQVVSPSLGDMSAPSWSPDGSRLAFVQTIREGGGDLRGACSGFRGGYSSDCRREIFVVNVDGTGLTRLTYDSTWWPKSGLAWSPDGSMLAFEQPVQGRRSEGVFLLHRDGSITKLTNNGSAPQWAPSGARLAFDRLSSGGWIYTMPVNGGKATRVATWQPAPR